MHTNIVHFFSINCILMIILFFIILLK